MWFRNLRIYRFVTPLAESAQALELKLLDKPLHPCAKTQQESVGWVSPFGSKSDILVHACNGFWRICLAKQMRILPAAVIKEHLEDKIAHIENTEFRTVFRKEKTRLKEEITAQLLPKAFTRTTFTQAYVDTQRQLLLIDSANANKAEWLIHYLRETYGKCEVIPMQTKSAPQDVLTRWVEQGPQAPFDTEDNCQMLCPKSGASLKVSKQDLLDDTILEHVKQGKLVNQLALCYDELLSMKISDELCLRAIKPLAIMQEKLKENNEEDIIAQQDADFSLMALEYRQLLDNLINAMGGLLPLKQPNKQPEAA